MVNQCLDFYLIYLLVKTAQWLEEGCGKPVLGVLPDIPVSEDNTVVGGRMW